MARHFWGLPPCPRLLLRHVCHGLTPQQHMPNMMQVRLAYPSCESDYRPSIHFFQQQVMNNPAITTALHNDPGNSPAERGRRPMQRGQQKL
eukprot:5971906-Amphidinium_carterae.1